MTQLLDQSTEQRFIQTGVSWDNFKAIQSGFVGLPSVCLFYYAGALEILAPAPKPEIVKGNIGYLVEDYLLNQGLDFVATGSFSQEKESVVSVQADESYCFSVRKSGSDLAIEVVMTSGGPNKLKRYQALGVPEVWFWQDGVISVDQLTLTDYQRVNESQLVPGINRERLARWAAIESRTQAVRAFRLEN
jgi:Uma2 family endonuclease